MRPGLPGLSRLPCRPRYVPVAELDGRSHVVVDGAARAGTAWTLSHWPATPTPRGLWADTSAEIVLRALELPRRLPPVPELATVDHYDADGAIALALLVTEGLAEAHGALLAGAARAGDFDVVRRRDEALVAFALGALAPAGCEQASEGPEAPPPVGAVAGAVVGGLAAPGGEDVAGRALGLIPALAACPAGFEGLWGPEAEAYDRARRLLEAGSLRIEEHPELDLAVVRVDEHHPELVGAGWAGAVVHPAVVHSATSCLRVATLCGHRYELRFRYESWVRLASRRPRPRVDLGPLALALSEAERDGGRWGFDGAGAITPALRREDRGPSTLSRERFLAAAADALAALDRGPGAWDPYAEPPPAAGGTGR
jgi:hypothetical protein